MIIMYRTIFVLLIIIWLLLGVTAVIPILYWIFTGKDYSNDSVFEKWFEYLETKINGRR